MERAKSKGSTHPARAPSVGGDEVADASLLGAVVDQAPDALLVVDEQGWIVLANQAACALLGRDTAELVGLSVDRLVPERLRAGHAAHRARFLRAPRPRAMGENGAYPSSAKTTSR